MRTIDPGKQSKKENYKLLIGSILPRPIAFVTSLSPEGIVNAAPFSFFNVIATDPPLIGFSVSRKPNGDRKDTARNIAWKKEFVVHVVDEDNVSMVNETSVDFPPDVSEAEKIGFHVLPGKIVQVPRLAEGKIQMECRLQQILELGGRDTPNADFIIGEIVQFHVDDSLYFEGKIDTDRLRPVGRMAGTEYGKIGETFSLPRLTYEEWRARNT
ncbi:MULTISPECIES: flavin reductase family protein [unclassified Thermoactinomyces]|jgi:flavin reductase (DIM6/NTAB) family NADH-FMN oxidoreductase RutF|uniref:flavin reductase family protein n=1 Tax=unclassified Thermoactinomyces TaxID=2634588 RepID=UPI0018DD79E9|nr:MULTISPECIES: flavin reductase family protein [unclassified Thermoactinomyces]MBH8596811.1 flavin reductase family protein [Thermoactinomyces sp. CICC 10523]MBH8606736.1 flavin reductase family protein [Thermoactinomyces sp. CICC 10521]